MKAGIILSCCNKLDDLITHLEIIKYYQFPYEIIIVYMNENIPYLYMQEIKKYHHVLIDGVGFHIGALLSLVYGLRKAHELGIDYIRYSNCDDWLLNQSFVYNNFQTMSNYDCAGYNWFNKDGFFDFALNELYLRVDKFYNTSFEMEEYFRRSNPGLLCEFKMARWVTKTIDHSKFYRLQGREREIGIGHDRYALDLLYEPTMPDWYWGQEYGQNNRFFNKEWQLIGSHDNDERYRYWQEIKKDVPFATNLEKEPHFSRWLQICRTGGPWNLPSQAQQLPSSPQTHSKIKKVPKKIFCLKR